MSLIFQTCLVVFDVKGARYANKFIHLSKGICNCLHDRLRLCTDSGFRLDSYKQYHLGIKILDARALDNIHLPVPSRLGLGLFFGQIKPKGELKRMAKDREGIYTAVPLNSAGFLIGSLQWNTKILSLRFILQSHLHRLLQ